MMIEFFVPGIPRPGGSKRVFINKKTGKPIVTDDAGKANKEWKAVVKLAGSEAMKKGKHTEVFRDPIILGLIFLMLRPKYHFGKKGLKPSAPADHIISPDLLKLARSTEDALTGVIWADDAQIISEHITKRYALKDESPGCWVLVDEWREK